MESIVIITYHIIYYKNFFFKLLNMYSDFVIIKIWIIFTHRLITK